MHRIRILLADDHPVVRDGIRERLSREADLEVAGEAANGDETIRQARRLRPDVVLLDVAMPGPGAVTVVDRANLDVHSGEVILILGPSGSGKTTLLSMMGCLLRPTSGQVRVVGQDVEELSDRDRSHLRCDQIGFVFQSFNLLSFLSVQRNVEVALNLAGIHGQPARERAADLLGQLKLSHRLTYYPRDLSGGEKQRVSIARALANSPRLVLADEPTGSLDSKAGRVVADLLTGLARQRGSGVVIVTHDTRILDVADRVLCLADGVLKEQA